jgi:hypothetical protein
MIKIVRDINNKRKENLFTRILIKIGIIEIIEKKFKSPKNLQEFKDDVRTFGGGFLDNDSNEEKIIYHYNDNNKLYEVVWYDSKDSGRTLLEYDSNGNHIKETEFDSRDSVITKTLLKYDSDGKLTEEVECDSKDKEKMVKTINQDGSSLEKYFGDIGLIEEIHFDVKDNLTKMIDYGLGTSNERVISSETICKYNKEGNKIEETFTDFKEKNYKTISKYDTEGKLIESVNYISDEKISWTEESYDSRGFHTQTKLIHKDDGIIYVQRNQYNDDGKLYKDSEYDSDSDDSLREYWKTEYDSVGNIIKEEMYNSEHQLKYRESNEYNSDGMIIEKRIIDKNSELS